MKKLQLIILSLMALTSVLLAEQIDHDKIMPKKLIYSELPNDYPKELYELFEFYYETWMELYNRIQKEKPDLLRVNKIPEEIVNSLSLEKIKRICYLDWVARNQLNEYQAEFLALNTYKHYIATPKEKVKLLYIPDGYFLDGEYMPGIKDILIYVRIRFRREIKYIYFVQNPQQNKFIHGTLINSEEVNVYPKYKKYSVKKLSILTKNNIIEEVYFVYGLQTEYKLVIGDEYVLDTRSRSSNFYSYEQEIATVKYFKLFVGEASIFAVENEIVKGKRGKIIPDILPEEYYERAKGGHYESYIFEAPVNVIMDGYNNIGNLIQGESK